MVDAVDVVGECRWLVGRKEAERPQTTSRPAVHRQHAERGGKEPHQELRPAAREQFTKPGQLICIDVPGQSRVYINNCFLVPANPQLLPTMDNPSIDDLTLSDTGPDVIFDSPGTRKKKSKDANANATPLEGSAPSKSRPVESRYSTEEARNAALRKELDSVRNVNKVIEDVVESLQKAKNNMDVRDYTLIVLLLLSSFAPFV